MAAIISSHNTKVLAPYSDHNTRSCGCRKKQQWPLEGNFPSIFLPMIKFLMTTITKISNIWLCGCFIWKQWTIILYCVVDILFQCPYILVYSTIKQRTGLQGRTVYNCYTLHKYIWNRKWNKKELRARFMEWYQFGEVFCKILKFCDPAILNHRINVGGRPRRSCMLHWWWVAIWMIVMKVCVKQSLPQKLITTKVVDMSNLISV